MNRWDLLEGFSEKEAWGQPHRMDFFLLMLMEKVRAAYLIIDPDARFIVHCGFETTGHAPNSQHGLGKAVDFHIESRLPYSTQVPAMLSILAELQVSHQVGMGIYPEWNTPGFHLDTRGHHARWGRLGGVMVDFDTARAAIKGEGNG